MPSVLDAVTEAQRITFTPMLFQTALRLHNAGVLGYSDQQSEQGAPLNAITEHTVLDGYAVGVLLDMGLGRRVITYKEGIYYLTKIGRYLLHDTMIRINMDFTQDVCYQGPFFLADSLNEGKPSGLKVFGDWSTIYPALPQLSDTTRDSWFAFDRCYSDGTFSTALSYVFANSPTTLYDVGGSTDKWALRCCKFSENITVTLLDLSQRIVLAKESIADTGFSGRIDFHAVDILNGAPLPGEADTWWMSRLLDCFSPEQIINIFNKIASIMKPGVKFCITELFWDAQRFEATSFSLNASSLYFTCMANNDNRSYSVEKFYDYLNKAGFQVAERHNNLGAGHTFLICQRK